MLEEVDVQLALVLASFKKWASEMNGSCVAMLVQLGFVAKRQTHKWDQQSFLAALEQTNFPRVSETTTMKQAATMLYEALDVENLGFFTAQDVAFLDKWTPTPWLIADPSEEEKERFVRILRSRFSNLIVAWRKLLDRDNSNKVSYKAFLEACQKMKIQNPPGIWRALDDDTSGCISLNEIDQEAADALMNFKRWAEATFGTITHMFHVIDKAKVGKVSFPIFRRALRNFGFEGDAGVLFQSLKPCAKNSKKSNRRHELTLQDLLYLSTWETEGETNAGKADGDKQSNSPSHVTSKCAPFPPSSTVPPESAQSRGTAVSSRPSQAREVMQFCRSKDEHRAYVQAGHRQKAIQRGLEEAYGRNRNEKFLPPVDQAHQKLPRLVPSPFMSPAVAPLAAMAGAGRKAHGSSRSASHLEHLPMVSPNGGSRAADRMQLRPGDITDRIMGNREQRMRNVVSLPSL
jgi:Ca2+-binding EF-hand superfamily protein